MANLDRLDRTLYLLNKKIQFSLLTPTNIEHEKKKVLQDITYDPHFQYKKPTDSLLTLKKDLLELSFDESILGRLLHHKRNEMMKVVTMLDHIGTDKFTSHALNVYGRPSIELVKKAQQLLKASTEERVERSTGVSIVKKFLDAFSHRGLRWKVKERDMMADATFDVGERTLFINSRRRFSPYEIERLLVHKVGTHIVRAENAKKQRHKLFLTGFPNYLLTEEGLAVYNEEQSGLLNAHLLKIYAGRVLAVDLALQRSFSSVYASLRDYFSDEEAFYLTMRVKRGLKDTSTPGGLTKDYFYLEGYHRVKEYVKKGGKIDLLYTGRIGIEHVPFLRYLG